MIHKEFTQHLLAFGLLLIVIAYQFWNVYTAVKHGKVHTANRDATYEKGGDNGYFYFFMGVHLFGGLFFSLAGIYALWAMATQ